MTTLIAAVVVVVVIVMKWTRRSIPRQADTITEEFPETKRRRFLDFGPHLIVGGILLRSNRIYNIVVVVASRLSLIRTLNSVC